MVLLQDDPSIVKNISGFTGTFPPVKALLVEWGSLYVIGKNNEIYKLNEKGLILCSLYVIDKKGDL